MQSDWHDNFANALLGPEESTPPGLVDPYGEPALKRFSVYRNNIVAGLTEALKVDFPAVRRIVSEEFFEAMTRAYGVRHQPRTPVLLEYGKYFPVFIGDFEPAAALPYLGDVARIERAWLEAYHALEASSLHSSNLASIPPGELNDVRFRLHPSVQMVRSKFPAFTIWSTNIEGATPVAIDLEGGGENVLVSRPAAEVEVRRLSNAGMEFVRSIAEGNTVIVATGAALTVDRKFDLSIMLEGLIQAGIFRANENEYALGTKNERGYSGF